MKILFLTFYYFPDLSAGSFRATSIANTLKELAPDVDIQVVTTLPNRYRSYAVKASRKEVDGKFSVYRIELPSHHNGFFDQSRAFLFFIKEVLSIVHHERYDLVFSTSSRLLTATLGAWIAWRKKSVLYLDIRDVFVDTIRDVVRPPLGILVQPFLGILEKLTVRRAKKVNLVSEGFKTYFECRYPTMNFSYFTNGIDSEFIGGIDSVATDRVSENPLRVVYAGNLGDGQGMHLILPALAKKTMGRLHFKVFGDGGRRELLLRALRKAEVNNVELLPPIPRDHLVDEYRKADILFLHLNDHHAFKRVLPSKVFEYGATGKPIWAGVPGFSSDFIRREMENVAVFPPCNVELALCSLSSLTIETRPRTQFVAKYSRTEISRRLATDIILTAYEHA